jgi:transcriptional regulator with XRE-family HTH domain
MAVSFSAELAALMAERGMSGCALARRVPCDRGLISRYVNAKQKPSLRMAQRLDEVLSAEGRLVALAPRASARKQPDKCDQHPVTENVIDVLDRIRRLTRAVDPDVISGLQDDLRDTIRQYENLDHSTLGPSLVKRRVWVGSLLDECSHPPQHLELFQIAGVTSGLLGYVAVGRGAFPLARAYCAEAFHLGRLAHDANLQAWARGLQSFCEYYSGQYHKALQLATDGLNYAASGPQSVRLTINGAARAMGKLGDAEGVRRAVDRAYDLLSRNDVPAGVPSSISLECYSAAQTASNAATAYVSLGIPEKVRHYVNLALPEINRSDSPWSRSLVMIDLALSLIRPRHADLDHASELVLDALIISQGRPIISVQQRAEEFIHDASERWRNAQQISAVVDASASLKLR